MEGGSLLLPKAWVQEKESRRESRATGVVDASMPELLGECYKGQMPGPQDLLGWILQSAVQKTKNEIKQNKKKENKTPAYSGGG